MTEGIPAEKLRRISSAGKVEPVRPDAIADTQSGMTVPSFRRGEILGHIRRAKAQTIRLR